MTQFNLHHLLLVTEIKSHVFLGTVSKQVNDSDVPIYTINTSDFTFKQHKYICLIIKIFDIGIVTHYPDRFLFLNYTEVVDVKIYYHICEQIIS